MKELDKLIMAFAAVFIPRQRAPGTYWIGGWVGLRTGLDVVEKRNILPLPGIQPQRHGHKSDKNGAYSASHLFFTRFLSLIASFMRACS
jgi:hypothetical protein